MCAFSALHSCHSDLTIINVQEVMRYLMWPVASAGGQSSSETQEQRFCSNHSNFTLKKEMDKQVRMRHFLEKCQCRLGV